MTTKYTPGPWHQWDVVTLMGVEVLPMSSVCHVSASPAGPYLRDWPGALGYIETAAGVDTSRRDALAYLERVVGYEYPTLALVNKWSYDGGQHWCYTPSITAPQRAIICRRDNDSARHVYERVTLDVREFLDLLAEIDGEG